MSSASLDIHSNAAEGAGSVRRDSERFSGYHGGSDSAVDPGDGDAPDPPGTGILRAQCGYRRGFGVTRVAVGTRCLSHTKRSWKIRVTRKIGWSIDPRIFREARIFRANPTPGRRQRSNTRTPVSRQRAASRGPAVTRRARGTRRQARGTPVVARARSGLPWRATQCRPNRPPPRCHGCSVASMISRRAGQAVSQFERDPGIPPINSLRISGKRVQGLRAGRSALPRWRSPRPRWTW